MKDKPPTGKETRPLGHNEKLFFLNVLNGIRLTSLVTGWTLPPSFWEFGKIFAKDAHPVVSVLQAALTKFNEDVAAYKEGLNFIEVPGLIVDWCVVAEELLAGEPPKKKGPKVKLPDESEERLTD